VAADKPERRVEAHLLDFSGDLYGRELEIATGAKLRDEIKFSSMAELQAQIARDVAAVRSLG
jgi:riboflavin kinase/FMN adenylyltransferase